MTTKTKGNLLVAIQLLLIAAAALVPNDQAGWGNLALATSIIGWLLLTLGAVLAAIGLFSLGPGLTASPIPNQKNVLVRSGIYRTMRHPVYTGLLMLTMGLALIYGPLPHLVIWIALVAVLNYKAAWEERLLSERYPEYAEYKAQTGRFLPRLKG